MAFVKFSAQFAFVASADFAARASALNLRAQIHIIDHANACRSRHKTTLSIAKAYAPIASFRLRAHKSASFSSRKISSISSSLKTSSIIASASSSA